MKNNDSDKNYQFSTCSTQETTDITIFEVVVCNNFEEIEKNLECATFLHVIEDNNAVCSSAGNFISFFNGLVFL